MNTLPSRNAVDCVGPAFETAKTMMFKPFQWAKWWRIGLLGLATGEAAGSGGCNFNLGDLSELGKATRTPPQEFLQSVPPWQNLPMAQLAALITILVVLLVLLVLVHLYIGSVLRFVLFDAVTRGRYRIREGWNRWHAHGMRYFGFQLLLIFISLVGYGVLIGLPVLVGVSLGVFKNAQQHWGLIALGVLVFLPLVLLFALALAIVLVFFKDFAVPIMALENLPAMDAWRRVLAMVKPAKGEYALYIIMKIGLTIGAAIVVGIAQFIVFIIPIIIVVAIGVGVFAAVPGLIKTPAGIALVVTVAVMVVFVLMLVGAIIAAPVVVFFQAYVLTFFSSRYEPLWRLMYPAPPPIPEPPPLPAM
ncbi:MAG: hypothetical protein ABIP12_06240 [Terriglobales bacterium]